MVDRAFIDAHFWDRKKRTLASRMVKRMKSNLCVDSTEGLPFAEDPINVGVVSALQVTLTGSPHLGRIIRLQTLRGRTVVLLLTNDIDLKPSVGGFLYSRRWEEEKCFDTWKNDLALARRVASSIATENQVRLAIVAGILMTILLHTTRRQYGVSEEKD